MGEPNQNLGSSSRALVKGEATQSEPSGGSGGPSKNGAAPQGNHAGEAESDEEQEDEVGARNQSDHSPFVTKLRNFFAQRGGALYVRAEGALAGAEG